MSRSTKATAPGICAVWWMAIRPRTLVAAPVPVAVGLAWAQRRGAIDVLLAAATLATALLLQVAANLANDYYDARAGVDTSRRLGPQRVTQTGLVSETQIRQATLLVFLLAATTGLYLIARGGWPIALLGLLALGCAFAYSAGPWPLAWHGLGEVLVFAFFGLAAVAGTVFLQQGRFDSTVLCTAVPVGLLASAMIVVNNLRDIATDRAAGKRTIAVRLGDRASRGEYAALVIGAFACLVWIVRLLTPWALLPLASLPLAVAEVIGVWRATGARLNHRLAGTARLHLVFGLLLALGLLQ